MGNCVCSQRQEVEENKEPERQEIKQKKEPELIHMVSVRGCTHCPRSNENWTCPYLGSCSCPQNASPSPLCVFYSPRIQGLHEGESTELETTQQHWTEMDSKIVEEVGKENREYFDKVLMQHWDRGVFYAMFEGLKVGDKLGEGGQAEIFEAEHDGWYKHKRLVAKIFKGDVSLKDLERQWPPHMLSMKKREETNSVYNEGKNPLETVYGGAFIRDGIHKNKFAFVMPRFWGDLRALIDKQTLKLLQVNNHGPPFSNSSRVFFLIEGIAHDIFRLHQHNNLHRDIKASNVLMPFKWVEDEPPCLMDFECALGAMGTGFWRAPEILEQVQRRVSSHEVVFTKEADIYSFGMTCYEIITGRIPFEDHPRNDYSIVLRGERPELPRDLHPFLKELVSDCWHQDPQKRPRASAIYWRIRLRACRWSDFDFSEIRLN